jgi:predicted RNase H-like nuclease (RuvC/YqgF family)
MDLNWLSDLEQKVRAASEELKAHRKENRALKSKVKQLQQKLSDARGKGQVKGDWGKEREAIRQRVEKLANHLEKLL